MVISIITEDEMKKFRKLLGAIGGSYASAFVIPHDAISDSLWKKEMSEFEQLFGIPPDDNDDSALDELSVGSPSEVIEENDLIQTKTENENIKNYVNNKPDNDELKSDCGSSGKGMSVKSECGNKDSVKECSSVDADNVESTSFYSDLTMSDFSGNEEISDDSDDVNKNENNKTDDMSNKELCEFGLKMLNYCNKHTHNPILSYSELETSLNNFVNGKCNVENDKPKSNFEPTGALDIDVIESFINHSNNKCNNFMHLSHEWDVRAVSEVILNDTRDTCLSKVLNELSLKSENKNLKDPEIYSGSSSDDDIKDNCCNDDKVYDTREILQSTDGENSNKSQQLTSPKMSPAGIDDIELVIEEENSKKRKNNNAISSSSSIEGKQNNGKNNKKKSMASKKMKQTEKFDEVDDKIGKKGTVLFSRNVSSKGSSKKSNCEVSDCRGNKVDENSPSCSSETSGNYLQNRVVTDLQDNSNANYVCAPLGSIPNSTGHGRGINATRLPSEIDNWHNLWQRQQAQLQWYLGYSQYLNYMLNQKK